jgi:hypothetical protein
MLRQEFAWAYFDNPGAPCVQPLSIPKQSDLCNAILDTNGIADLFVLTASTVDSVSVTGGDTFIDNGIKTRERSAGVAGHAPESIGGAGQQGRGGDGCDGLHGSDGVDRVCR